MWLKRRRADQRTDQHEDDGAYDSPGERSRRGQSMHMVCAKANSVMGCRGVPRSSSRSLIGHTMRPLALLGLLLFALPSAAYSQANLRAWNEVGQTWLVWQDTAPLTGLESYELYRTSAPITDVTTAMRMGRIYPQDGRGTRLKLAQPTAT